MPKKCFNGSSPIEQNKHYLGIILRASIDLTSFALGQKNRLVSLDYSCTSCLLIISLILFIRFVVFLLFLAFAVSLERERGSERGRDRERMTKGRRRRRENQM